MGYSIIQGATSVTLIDDVAYTLDGFAVIVDDCPSFNLDSPQFIIALACLYKTGKPGISPQVGSLLRLSIRPENYLVIYQHIPHRYQVRPSVVVNGGYLKCALLCKKCTYFFVVHADQVSTTHVLPSIIAFRNFSCKFALRAVWLIHMQLAIDCFRS